VVVSDAGPLIALGRLDLLVLLSTQFAEVQVPQQVIKECMSRPGNPDVARILTAFAQNWLTSCEAVPVAAQALGAGERAAIARALEIGAGLLADDQDARLFAQAMGLQTIGTLGVLVRAKRAGVVTSIRPLIEQLRAGGQRLGAGVVAQALAAAGEADS
jgi:uncharacterized protein